MRISILEELKDSLLAIGPLTYHNDNVWEQVCAVNTWGSNAIDGSDLTRAQVERLVIQRLSIGGHPVWKVLETVQHARAFMGLLDRVTEPITVATSVELHDHVLRGVLQRAGEFREVDIHISGSHHVPLPASQVVEGMRSWEEGYRKRCREGWAVFELAAWMHQGFEAIHPFSGGNGRVGRLLMNLHFLKHDWPPVNVTVAERQHYFDALEAGHEGDLEPLVGFLMLAMGRSLITLLDLVGKDEDALRPLEEMEERGEGFLAYSEHMAEDGRLPAIRMGNTWHSSRRALELFIRDG